MKSAVLKKLGDIGAEFRCNEDMSCHTSFKIGGPAGLFIMPGDEESLIGSVLALKEAGVPYRILGRGTNLLVSDAGVRDAVICTGGLRGIHADGDILSAGAGESLMALSKKAAECGLAGLEFACGIPGSLGGAVVMNAGAYGGEMKDVLLDAVVLTADGERKTVTVSELSMGYRISCVESMGYTVMSARLKLRSGNEDDIRVRMNEYLESRNAKQPLQYPSAGSAFKRPQGYYAGKLIMDAGLAGFAVGGAEVSEKHCGFIINKNNATARDVKELISVVQKKVYDRFKVALECEIKIWD